MQEKSLLNQTGKIVEKKEKGSASDVAGHVEERAASAMLRGGPRRTGKAASVGAAEHSEESRRGSSRVRKENVGS